MYLKNESSVNACMAYGCQVTHCTSECCSSHNYIHSVLPLTTDGGGDSEDVEGLLEKIVFQESGNSGKSEYTHTCIVGFYLEAFQGLSNFHQGGMSNIAW